MRMRIETMHGSRDRTLRAGFVWLFAGWLAVAAIGTARADVTLRLATWVGYSPDAQVAEFQAAMSKKYGQKVELEIHYINGYDEIFTLLRQGKADVVVLVDHILHDGRYRFVANELILALERERLPNYPSVLDVYKPYVQHQGQVYAAPIASGPYGLAYNTRYFSSAPHSWSVLWDPKYKGKYAITNGIFEVNLYVTALEMGYSRDALGSFDFLNNPAFHKRLRELVENADSFWPGIDEAHHLRGLHLATSWGFSLPALRELGEHWKMAEPEEGSPVWIDAHAVSAKVADDPVKLALAHEWIDYTLSPQFQLDVIVAGIATPPVTTAAVERLTPAQRSEFHLDDREFIRKYRVVYPTIKSERDRNGIKMLWQRANRGVEKPVRTASR